MNTKLTLTIEEKIIRKAKMYAKKNGQSLSGLIENYLKMLTSLEKEWESELSPLVKSLKGSFKMPEDFDYKRELTEILSNKYSEK